MNTLRVLSLHGTGITSLPSSFSCLKKLRSLYLNDCDGLNKLPATINQLKELEVLDIRGTSIPSLPAGILNIVSLRCLRVSFAIEKRNLPTGSKRRKIFNLFSPNPSWVIFPPEAHTKLSNLEEMAIDLRGEVTDQVRDDIKREAAEFRKRKDFKFELNPPPGQSSRPNSQARKEQTEELSDDVQEPARTPSNADERLAGTSQSAAGVPQSNGHEISDGQSTSRRPFRGQNDSPEIASPGPGGSALVTSAREDKGKAVAEPPEQSKKSSKHQPNRQLKGLQIREPSETNTTAIYSTETRVRTEEPVHI